MNYFFSILRNSEFCGFFLLLANQQVEATIRFRDTCAFYVAQTPKKIPFTLACVFTNLLKHTWANTGVEDPAKAQDILENDARVSL